MREIKNICNHCHQSTENSKEFIFVKRYQKYHHSCVKEIARMLEPR